MVENLMEREEDLKSTQHCNTLSKQAASLVVVLLQKLGTEDFVSG